MTYSQCNIVLCLVELHSGLHGQAYGNVLLASSSLFGSKDAVPYKLDFFKTGPGAHAVLPSTWPQCRITHPLACIAISKLRLCCAGQEAVNIRCGAVVLTGAQCQGQDQVGDQATSIATVACCSASCPHPIVFSGVSDVTVRLTAIWRIRHSNVTEKRAVACMSAW